MTADESPITSFTGEFDFLSNFYPVEIYRHNMMFPSVEHTYQAEKCPTQSYRKKFAAHTATKIAPTAGQAKRMGRAIALPYLWDERKVEIMRGLLQSKFFMDSKLRGRLAATRGRELIEGNTWGDTFWGVCDGVGQNHLGRLLMEIRDGK